MIIYTTRILLRLSEDSDKVIIAIKELKGDEKYLRILTEENDFGISRLGGRLLSRLVDQSDILSLIPTLNEAKNKSDDLKKKLQLLHAATSRNTGYFVQKITEKHLADILFAFGQRQNNQVLVLLSKITSMFAAHQRAADFLIGCGASTIFFRHLLAERTPIDVVTHILDAIWLILNSSSQDFTEIVREIGVAVLESLRRHMSVASATASALALLDTAEDRRDDIDLLSSQFEYYPFIVIDSMRQRIHKENIQLC